MWGFLVALISGALMSIQGVFNTEVTKQTSLWVSTGWVQLSAFAVCVLAWLFTGRESVAALWQVDNKYTLLGGVVGAFITITVIQSMGALGPAKSAMLIVISQLAVAYVIELFGLFGVDKEYGLMQEGFGLKVVKLGENGVTEKDILVHDAHCMDNTLQLKLALMEGPDFPVALGVIRDVEAPTYDDAVNAQIEEVAAKKKYHNFQELLMTNDIWEVK